MIQEKIKQQFDLGLHISLEKEIFDYHSTEMRITNSIDWKQKIGYLDYWHSIFGL